MKTSKGKRLAMLAAALGVMLAAWWFYPAHQRERRNAALFEAARLGQPDEIRRELDGGADVNGRDPQGITPLMFAARGNHPRIENPSATDDPGSVELLLARGAEANARTDSGFVALFWAARYGHERIAKALIGHGADVTLKDKDGMTALKWARINHQTSVVSLLESAGARE